MKRDIKLIKYKKAKTILVRLENALIHPLGPNVLQDD